MKYSKLSQMKVGDKLVVCPGIGSTWEDRYTRYFKEAFSRIVTISKLNPNGGHCLVEFSEFDFANYNIDKLIDWEETNKFYYSNDLEELNYIQDQIEKLNKRAKEVMVNITNDNNE